MFTSRNYIIGTVFLAGIIIISWAFSLTEENKFVNVDMVTNATDKSIGTTTEVFIKDNQSSSTTVNKINNY